MHSAELRHLPQMSRLQVGLTTYDVLQPIRAIRRLPRKFKSFSAGTRTCERRRRAQEKCEEAGEQHFSSVPTVLAGTSPPWTRRIYMQRRGDVARLPLVEEGRVTHTLPHVPRGGGV